MPSDSAGLERAPKRKISTHTLTFFALAYMLSWGAWVPMLFAPNRLQYLHYLGSLGPLLAAVILTFRDSGRTGVARLISNVTRWRVPIRWWLLAFSLPVILFGVGAGLSAVTGDGVDLSEFLGSKEFAHVGWLLIPIEILFFGLGEEAGWRGYAIPSLERSGWSSYGATTIFAFFWAGWHLPLFWYTFGLRSLTPALIPGWLLSILFGAYLTTFLFNSAQRSILVIAVFHGMVDIVSISRSSTTISLITVNMGLIAAAVFVTVKYQPRLRAPTRHDSR